ncbi:MAG TPA: phosphonate ABC transporter, permease protein PhnE [Thermoflexia bacterium]|jgi:phosphonate transport system permease protein|nr:phosphonate ABC transporter, permease protein PhnE [Thermoflexia bacterium]
MATRTIQREKLPSLVPPPVAGIASLIIPGLGQVLARETRRGLLLFGSLVSITGLMVWRIYDLAHLEPGPLAMLRKAIARRPVFVVPMLIGIVALWLWNAWDAYRQAQPDVKGGAGIFVLVIVLFFTLGWQIGEIDLYKLGSELPDAWRPLSQVLWPWPAAVEREEEILSAGADILVPCDDNPPPPPEEVPGQPYLVATPTCGELSELGENNQIIPGTTLKLVGRGFAPNTETKIWWVDPLGNEFVVRQSGEYVVFQTDDTGSFEIELIMPYRLIPPSAAGPQIHRVEARQVVGTGPARPSEPLRISIARMIETIFLGMMATIFGIFFSIPISFLAAKNLMSGSWLTLAVYYFTRTILNIVRSIEPLIWAIIAVVVVGLGPFAGILALTIHSIAALGKLYSEAIESIDPGPIEAIQATGANRLQTIVYAVIPQMIPPFVSFSIYRWDINVRMSTVIGLVGGGGIGFVLIQYIKLLDYRAAGIAVWFIAITVAILDYVSAEIRQRFV